MLIGHYAPALAAATLPRAPRLGPLFVAAALLDIGFLLLSLAGVEHYALAPWFTTLSPLDVYDARWTHSLIGACGWAAAFALAYRLAGGSKDAAWIGAGVVIAPWFLNLFSHAPDLTIAGGVPRYGLGLWNHPYVEMPLELGLTALALNLYAERTRARDWRGRATLALLAGALLSVQLAAWFGPKPDTILDPAPPMAALRMLAAYAMLTVFAWWTASSRRAA